MKSFIKATSFIILLIQQLSCTDPGLSITEQLDQNAQPIHCQSFFNEQVVYFPSSKEKRMLYPMENQNMYNYGAFPNGLSINPNTGVIDLSKSEPGLKYHIYRRDGVTPDTCWSSISVAGLNFDSGIISRDSLSVIGLQPIYSKSKTIPVNFTLIDIDERWAGLPGISTLSKENKNSNLMAFCPETGRLKLKPTALQLHRKAHKDGYLKVDIRYTMECEGEQATDTLTVKVYFFENTDEVPQYLKNEVKYKHEVLFPTNESIELRSSKFIPRPPTVVIVG